MPNVSTVTGYTSAAVASGGTIVATYPAGTQRGNFLLGVRHRLSAMGKVFNAPEDITVSLGATSATITYNGATTIPAGTRYTIELDRNTSLNPESTAPYAADSSIVKAGLPGFISRILMYVVDLGSPSTAAATAVCAAQAIAGAVNATINGTKATSGVAALGAQTGRAVNVVSSNAGDTTQTVTVRGKDIYGQNMAETIALNGTTTVSGKKAFYTVTSVAVSAALAGNLSVGDTTIIGLPVYLQNAVHIIKEVQDGAAATAGTTVAGLGIATAPSATSADVRGTYTPNSAPDGTKGYQLLMALPEPGFYGAKQYYA